MPLADPAVLADRLLRLRAVLAEQGVDAFLVPRTDEYQNEYVPASAERLAWLTGFTGSAGLAVVAGEGAALLVDGRYTLQAADQVDAAHWQVVPTADTPLSQHLAASLTAGQVLGLDPWLHPPAQVDRLREALAPTGATVAFLDRNPIDELWADRPAPPQAPVVPHPLVFTGRAAADKRTDLGAELAKAGAEAAVLTDPASIAWLLNVRGGDVPHTPLPLSYAVLHRDGGVDWLLDPAKATDDLDAHVGPAVRRHAPAALAEVLAPLKDRPVLIDADAAPAGMLTALEAAGATPVRGADPCLLPKATKTEAEIEGARAAHLRDGVAVTAFLAWLDRVGTSGIGEIEAATRLAELRAGGDRFRDLSFTTISGSGPNGAIVHYSVTPDTDRQLAAGELYLVDSGGQYLDGTTDVTRTVAIGPPTAAMRLHYTLVLKGHIALATARFPKGTTGGALDTLARLPLWSAGLDFAHGTGHGVGSYLSVHEGPQRIGKAAGGAALAPGMIVSNEPGYYKAGAYGIRIENLVLVREDGRDGDEQPMYGFETLTRAPLDRRLIAPERLDAAEIAWVDAYHAWVQDTVGPGLSDKDRAWLAAAAAPL